MQSGQLILSCLSQHQRLLQHDQTVVDILNTQEKINVLLSTFTKSDVNGGKKKICATCEARTHDLQIMRLTRCRLRQGGTCTIHSLHLLINVRLILTLTTFCEFQLSVQGKRQLKLEGDVIFKGQRLQMLQSLR